MVSGKRLNNLGAEIVARHFKILSGVKTDLGGNDEGPDPHEILESALAACTTITLQMYANRKKMQLESTNVQVKVESETIQETIISMSIALIGELTEEERKKLFEIAEKCPIHRLLKSQVTINTTHASTKNQNQ